MPKDPAMLLSYVNTQLRDHFSSLEAFCEDKGVQKREIMTKLAAISYFYDPTSNQFK
ncbi:MAG: DUF4250 domain-containing protein [Eubacteriales bacterium]|nr:DUF4250 domain-containing protein [Eubacteriales bacterium]